MSGSRNETGVWPVVAVAVIFVSLGLDTFAVALGLGVAGLPRARWWRIGLVFAACEGLMPVAGLLVGQRLGAALGIVAPYVAAGILVLLGAREIREAIAGDDDDDDDDATRAITGRLPRFARAEWARGRCCWRGFP